jgi:hypothetical protein
MEQDVEGGVVGDEAWLATTGRVLEAYAGDLADEIGNQPAHHGSGEGQVLFERAEKIEYQRLAGEEIVPEAVDVDHGAEFAVGDFILDEGDQCRVDG